MARLGKLHGQYFIANMPSLTFVPHVVALRQALVDAGKDTAAFDAKAAQIDAATDAVQRGARRRRRALPEPAHRRLQAVRGRRAQRRHRRWRAPQRRSLGRPALARRPAPDRHRLRALRAALHRRHQRRHAHARSRPSTSRPCTPPMRSRRPRRAPPATAACPPRCRRPRASPGTARDARARRGSRATRRRAAPAG